MNTARNVLLVEDNPTWKGLLMLFIEQALPGVNLQVAGKFQDADRELRRLRWDLLVTDIGLPPDTGHVLGMDLVRTAKTMAIPCIVVSETAAVTTQHAVDLVVEEEYKAKGFFRKQDLRQPERRKKFVELIHQLTATSPVQGEGAKGGEGRPTVVITTGTEDDPAVFLSFSGLEEPQQLPGGLHAKVFWQFVLRVVEGKPGKLVTNADLNMAIGGESNNAAEETVRGIIHDLNELVRAWAGFGEDEKCIVNKRGKGYRLNTDLVQWELQGGDGPGPRGGRSPRISPIDPHKLQENSSDRPLPDRPTRKPFHDERDN